MQFVANGPDIPDTLLQAHEDDRVVFFCGAGISYLAGLPDFKGLVAEIYRLIDTAPSDIERAALDRGQFDTTLYLLENRFPGGGTEVRRALAQALKPNLRRKGAIDTHTALLRLARNRKGVLRLVTTNFDRVFHAAAKRTRQVFHAHAAPMLPIPKNSRWNGLVYLHGLLPAKAEDTALKGLVVTSGDFGLAYLIERWAARFVSELFRNYVVCFVGYSINDPVMRYMMDALAADRILGEGTPQAWALGDCVPGQEQHTTKKWKEKGVTPILYHVTPGKHEHSALHQTLKSWAETYRDGITGKERIVVAHALARPSASTRQDNFVGRMLWALSDSSGLSAKRFADFKPVPPLDWLLDAFAVDRYGHADLLRFKVPPHHAIDEKLQFSLIHRPAPYPLAPPMHLTAGGITQTQWDDVMIHLAHWLVRHLNDPRLILWIAERGGQLHQQWIRQIEHRLDQITQMERDGKTSDLDEIRAHSSNAIPGPLMRTLWRLILNGRLKSPWRDSDLYRWKNQLKREGLTTTSRLALRELLAPKVILRKPFRWNDELEQDDEPTCLRQLVDWELVLAADNVHSALLDKSESQLRTALPALLDDLQQLLRDALDLRRELGEADEQRDGSFLDLPSIDPHWQNDGFREWVSLIELLRDAWLATRCADSGRSTRIATTWFDLPYPTFKRLAFFAAAQNECITPDLWVDWLLEDGISWLWQIDTQREVLQLLVLQGRQLTPALQERLEAAILAGPLHDVFPDDREHDQKQGAFEYSVWLRLAKLSGAGVALGTTSAARLADLSRQHPGWCLTVHGREEFPVWRSGTGDPDYEEWRDVDVAPRKRRELVQWLVKPAPERRPFYEDTWREVCRARFFHSLCALCDLARQDTWPKKRWQEALQVWSEDGMVLRSWRSAAPLLQTMPDAVVQELAHGVTRWLDAASSSVDRHEAILLRMCQRVLDLPLGEESGLRDGDGGPLEQPVMEAINHPIGHVTKALINLWFKRVPNDGDGLPTDIAPSFTRLCNTRVDRFRHGRVLLASRLIALFRVDRPWTERYLLPCFDWTYDRSEAKAAWEGFLWSPRLYQPLLLAFKPQFLETARHYGELGEHADRFASFLTYAALGPVDGYTAEDWRTALGSLSLQGLEKSAQALVQALEGAANQREEYWKNRIRPFWKDVWPKSRELATPGLSELLARLCIAAGAEFPAAVTAVLAWLRPVEHPFYIICRLHESGLCSRFTVHALKLLTAIIDEQSWVEPDLNKCLNLIVQADASLVRDPSYQRLREYARRRAE